MTAAALVVIFVCEHGSAKSLVAASWFDRLAGQQGLSAHALSRGTTPDESVPARVVEALRGDGFDVAAFRPRAITEAEAKAATRVVVIGADVGPWAAGAGPRLERWDDIPPISDGYAASRDALRKRVEALLRRLESEGRPDRRRWR